MSNHHVARLRIIALVPALWTLLSSLHTLAGETSQLKQCHKATPGKYLVLGTGFFADRPIARMLQEKWHSNGAISGFRYNRDGESELEQSYHGHWQASGPCQVRVDRENGERVSHTLDFLDTNGLPKLAFSLTPGSTLNKRYWRQSNHNCKKTQVAGDYLVNFNGQSLESNHWLNYSATMQLHFDGNHATGLLISSRNGKINESNISGNLRLEPTCYGLLGWKGSDGVQQLYRIIAESSGKRILAVSQASDLVSTGVIERQF